MNPSSRYEVLQLKQTLNDMLLKAGVRLGIEDKENTDECQEPSQLHRILELIKSEQDIFNIVFHEIIRQVGYSLIHIISYINISLNNYGQDQINQLVTLNVIIILMWKILLYKILIQNITFFCHSQQQASEFNI